MSDIKAKFSSEVIDNVLVKVSAPGKIILHGEHSVVYGKLALAASLDLRTKLTLAEHKGFTLNISVKNFNFNSQFDLKELQTLLNKTSPLFACKEKLFFWNNPDAVKHEYLLQSIEDFLSNDCSANISNGNSHVHMGIVSFFYLYCALFNSFGVKATPITVSIETSLTIGAGLGSSASYLVSLVATFFRYISIKEKTEHSESFSKSDLELISKWAFNAEKIIHGTPSGIDNTICTFGSMVKFRKNHPPEFLEHSQNFRVLLINSKVPKNTKVQAEKVRELKEKFPDVIEPILCSMEEVTKVAAGILNDLCCLDHGDGNFKFCFDKLGNITDINHNLLRTLGASHESLDRICAIVSNFGLHAKLTGAGGGGYCISLIPPFVCDSMVEEVITALDGNGFEAILTHVGGPGVTLD